MMKSYRSTIVALLIITTLVVLVPTPAHAAGDGIASDILGLFVGLLETVHDIIVQIIVWGGQLINWIIGSEINYGGAAVYNVWKVFRDICNSLFIIFFILIAFSTIFNSIAPKGAKAYYYSSALKGVILAALLINFSLPIGQIIIWAGNQASSLVAGLMTGKGLDGKSIDIADTVLVQGQLLQVAAGSNGLSLVAAPLSSVPDDQLDPAQLVAKRGYVGAPKKYFEDCLASGQNMSACSAGAARVQAPITSAAIDKEIQRLSTSPGWWDTLKDAGNYWINNAKGGVAGAAEGYVFGTGVLSGAAKGAWASAQSLPPPTEAGHASPSEQALKILSLFINNFFLGVLAFSFVTAVVVMVVRIPVTWFYLSLSALAFFSIGVPGSKVHKEWFGNMVGWNIFSPLYLFVIYIGMFVLSQQNSLLSGLKDAGAFAGVFGIGLFYMLAGSIFIGGAGAAWKYAFSLSDSLKKYVGGAADSLGVGEKANFGFNAVANKLGMTSSYEALKASGAQTFGDMGANIKGRAPNLFRSQEEAVAYKKMQYGVRGADAEVDKLAQKRIEAQKGMIEAAANKITDKDKKEAYLRSQFNSGNRDAALAAGEILMKQGKLSEPERQLLLKKYGDVSPVARKEFQKRLTEQLQKGSANAWDTYLDPTSGDFEFDKFAAAAKSAGKPEDVRKFLDAAMRGEVGNKAKFDQSQLTKLTELMKESPEDQRAFLEATSKNGRSKVASIELMAGMGLITDRNGKKVTTAEAMSDRADSLSDLDVLDFEDELAKRNAALPVGTTKEKMPDELQKKLKESLKKPEKFGKILRNVSSPEQQLRILDEYANIKIKSSAARKNIKELEAKDRKFNQGIKRLRKKQDKTTDKKMKKRLDAWIEDLESRRSDMNGDLQKLRKETTQS